MIPFTIANGILRIHGKRILLSHVTGWDETTHTVILSYATSRTDSLNLGSDASKLAAALDEWFVKERNPTPHGTCWTCGGPLPPPGGSPEPKYKNLTDEQIVSLMTPGGITHIREDQKE